MPLLSRFCAAALLLALGTGGAWAKDMPLNEESLNEIFDGARSGSKGPDAVAPGETSARSSASGFLKSVGLTRYDPRDRVVPGSTKSPAVPASGAGIVNMPGSGLKWNVDSLIREVLYQLKYGTGSVSLGEVAVAMGFGKFLSVDVLNRINSRGDVAINSGRFSNEGEEVRASAPLNLPVFNTAHFNIAPSVGGKVAANAEGGFTLSKIEGLSCGVGMLGLARIDEISFTPHQVRISRRFGFDIVIDLNKAQ